MKKFVLDKYCWRQRDELYPKQSAHRRVPASVYCALFDLRAAATWNVPRGMTCHFQSFDAGEDDSFRISLIYNDTTGTCKSTAQTDTYQGHFAKLVPNERAGEVAEFEAEDLELRGEMTVAINLADADGGK